MQAPWLTLMSVALVSAGVSAIHQEQTETRKQDENTAPFMRAKLVSSQHVLDGLVSENFALIRHGAENMKRMSEALQWPHAPDAVYEHYGSEFRRHCAKLMQLSDQKNLQDAHYTYLQMTTLCINCHNYVRGRFRIERDKDNPHGPVRLIPTEWDGPTFRPDRSASSEADRDN